MKKWMLVITVLLSQSITAQKYFTRTGKTHFKASVAAFEPVAANNNSTTAILKASTGDIAAQLFVSAFRFKVALMQEHFNENYMDSDVYPKATFKGRLEDFSLDKIASKKELPLKGILTIKGKQKEIELLASVELVNEHIKINAHFPVKPENFGIKIPSIVRKKIAKEILIDIAYELVKKE
ncbi:YceI family protein [Tenacibaculum amylolyticum]|uniref:YceI family protein n=1 Tax=Tenacibaculum amylolyticum TaxID=104269 RepID=UPI0038943814